MQKLDYQAVLDRVYSHFVVNQQPPGIVDGHIEYHQCAEDDQNRSCAIGIFDAERRLTNPRFACRGVANIFTDDEHILADVFSVSRLDPHDVHFLEDIQNAHDRSARLFADEPDYFAAALGSALECIADEYCVPALA